MAPAGLGNDKGFAVFERPGRPTAVRLKAIGRKRPQVENRHGPARSGSVPARATGRVGCACATCRRAVAPAHSRQARAARKGYGFRRMIAIRIRHQMRSPTFQGMTDMNKWFSASLALL